LRPRLRRTEPKAIILKYRRNPSGAVLFAARGNSRGDRSGLPLERHLTCWLDACYVYLQLYRRRSSSPCFVHGLQGATFSCWVACRKDLCDERAGEAGFAAGPQSRSSGLMEAKAAVEEHPRKTLRACVCNGAHLIGCRIPATELATRFRVRDRRVAIHLLTGSYRGRSCTVRRGGVAAPPSSARGASERSVAQRRNCRRDTTKLRHPPNTRNLAVPGNSVFFGGQVRHAWAERLHQATGRRVFRPPGIAAEAGARGLSFPRLPGRWRIGDSMESGQLNGPPDRPQAVRRRDQPLLIRVMDGGTRKPAASCSIGLSNTSSAPAQTSVEAPGGSFSRPQQWTSWPPTRGPSHRFSVPDFPVASACEADRRPETPARHGLFFARQAKPERLTENAGGPFLVGRAATAVIAKKRQSRHLWRHEIRGRPRFGG